MGLSFVRWLHQACLEDEDRSKPYASIYALGPQIEKTIGIDGDFDMARLAVMVREHYPASADTHLENLIRAEAVWRMQTLDMDPEGEIVPTGTAVATVCSHTGLDGINCRNPPAPGSARCVDHGGTVLDPGVRRSMLLIAYAKMMQGSALAVETLMDVAEHSGNDLARVHAAREILDRVGLVHEDGAHQKADDSGVEAQDALVESLKGKLASARDRLQLVPVPVDDDEPVDAEIIE